MEDARLIRAQLRKVPALAGLPVPELGRMSSVSTLRLCSAGEVIVRAGSPQPAVVIVTSGALVIYRRNHDRKLTLLLGIMPAPGVFGDAEAAARTHWTASARAEVDTTCVMVPVSAFQEVIRRSPAAAFELYQDASIRHLRANHTAWVNALYDVEARLLRLLLDYASRDGRRKGDDVEVGRTPAKTELAAALGVHRRTIIRTMKQLEQQGAISVSDKRGLIVHGLLALEKRLPPHLLGLSGRLGERATPIVSRWQASLDDDPQR